MTVTARDKVYPGERQRRVLIVENNLELAANLRTILESDGHEIEFAIDASDGISRAREVHPDIVVCDLAIPGVEALPRALRADEALKNACLVAISGDPLPPDHHLASEAGFAYHFRKPFFLEPLRMLLKEVPKLSNLAS